MNLGMESHKNKRQQQKQQNSLIWNFYEKNKPNKR